MADSWNVMDHNCYQGLVVLHGPLVKHKTPDSGGAELKPDLIHFFFFFVGVSLGKTL